MGKQSAKLGVGAVVSVAAKALNERWAKSRYPGTWKDERIANLQVIAVDHPTSIGETSHTVHVEFEGRVFKVAGSRVRCDQAAPTANQIGSTAPVPPAPPSTEASVPPRIDSDDIESGTELDGEVHDDPPTESFDIEFDQNLAPLVNDFRTSANISASLNVPFIEAMTPVDLLLHFLPLKFLENHSLPATNANAARLGLDPWQPLTMAELFAWIGSWFAMTFVDLPERADYWKTESDHWLRPVVDLERQSNMSLKRFTQITRAFSLCPRLNAEIDKFWEIRNFLEAWNVRLAEAFSPSWSVCLDESMVQWDDPSAPGYVYIERKFTRKGNEFHTIADTFSKIVFQVELVEGKDRPLHLGAPAHESTMGKTAALLLRLTEKAQLWGTNRVIHLDSGFCVLQGVLALRMHGLYAVAIIKKKRYWPKHIDGDFITTGVANLPLGTCVAQLGKARRGPFEFPFYLVALRDSNHVVLAMATQGTTLPTGKLVHRGPLSFRRPAVIDNYYISRHSVDDNNNLRQGHRGVEEAWESRTWMHRIFAYVLGVVESNAFCAHNYLTFTGKRRTHMQFRQEIVDGLFARNRSDPVPPPMTRKKRRLDEDSGHVKTPIPTGMRLEGGRWVAAPALKSKYPQLHCVECGERTRFYCSCKQSKVLCTVCWVRHVS